MRTHRAIFRHKYNSNAPLIDLSTIFGNTLVNFLRKDLVIGIPEITKAMATTIGLRNALPKFLAGILAAVANCEGNDLTNSTL